MLCGIFRKCLYTHIYIYDMYAYDILSIKIEPPGSSSSSSDSSSSSLRLLASVFPSKASPEPISARIQLLRLIWLRHTQ